VALCGLCHDRHWIVRTLENCAKSTRAFDTRPGEFELAVRELAGLGVTRLVLAHSHTKAQSRGGITPSNRGDGRGDVNLLGDPQFIQQVNALLKAAGIEPPLLHLIYSVSTREWGLYEINQQLGEIITRRRRGRKVYLRRGYRTIEKGRLSA